MKWTDDIIRSIYTAAILAVVAYLTRDEVRAAINRRTAEVEAKRREIEDRIERERKGREYLGVIRPTLIREEFGTADGGRFLGMEP